MKDFLKHFDYLSFVTETVIPAKIIDLIHAEILQRVIGEFSRRIRNCLGFSQSRICRPLPLLTFDQPFMDDGECGV